MLKPIRERELIERFAKKVRTDRSVICGIGDDTAVLSYTKDKYLLFTTDMLSEGTHFSRKQASLFQIGRKALAVNISDIAAMGGIPKYAQVAAGLPKQLTLRAADELFRGINSLAGEFNINIVGGDTVRSRCIVLCISLIAEVKRKNLTLRSGAKAGDLIFVTGSLGGSRRLKQFNFIPRVQEAQDIIKRFKPTAMIDLSDGLASDLQRIAEQSKVGAVIFEPLIPLAPGATFKGSLYDGEDFELLFTLSLHSVRKFYRMGAEPITCIGKIVEHKKGLKVIDKKARVSSLKQKGFVHFSN